MIRVGLVLGEVKPTFERYEPEAWMPVSTKKPTRDVVKEQARRLGGKPFAPTDKGLIGVVINALMEYCATEAHVERVVAKILQELPRWPDVTDIRQVALDTRDVEARPYPDCQKCGGCGFAPSKRIIDGVTYECSVRCDCWRFVRIAS